MCFCKWPPFPIPGEETMLIYLILSILFGIYFRNAEAVLPTEITINSLSQCDNVDNTNLDVSISISSLQNRSFHINGHVYLYFNIDESIDVNVVKLDRNGKVNRRYLKQVKLCTLLDKAIQKKLDSMEQLVVSSVCPIKTQRLEIDQVAMGDSFTILGVPYRMLNHPMQIELSRRNDTLACLEINLKNKLKVA